MVSGAEMAETHNVVIMEFQADPKRRSPSAVTSKEKAVQRLRGRRGVRSQATDIVNETSRDVRSNRPPP